MIGDYAAFERQRRRRGRCIFIGVVKAAARRGCPWALHLSTESMLHIVWGISGSIWIWWKRASFPSESQRRVSIPFSSSRIQHGGRTTLMEDAEGAALLQYLRALSPGVRIYADGTLELEQRSCRERSTNKKHLRTMCPAGAFLPDDGMPFKAAGRFCGSQTLTPGAEAIGDSRERTAPSDQETSREIKVDSGARWDTRRCV